jgi:hypothetical protein
MPHAQVGFILDDLVNLRIGNVPRFLRAAAWFSRRVEPVSLEETVWLRAVLEGHEEGAAVAGFADEDLVCGDAGLCDCIIEREIFSRWVLKRVEGTGNGVGYVLMARASTVSVKFTIFYVSTFANLQSNKDRKVNTMTSKTIPRRTTRIRPDVAGIPLT